MSMLTGGSVGVLGTVSQPARMTVKIIGMARADLKNTFPRDTFAEYPSQDAMTGIPANIFEIGSSQRMGFMRFPV
jgi:hypothetical protein